MDYSIDRLCKMSGVSARTLRYYDQIGLIRPARDDSNGYRKYGQKEVDRLQQILFYKELGFSLEDIKKLLTVPGFDRARAFECHLASLIEKRQRLDTLIATVVKSVAAMKGEVVMTDNEKFEGFKRSLIQENEEKYGPEIRAKYGDQIVEKSNVHLMGMTKEQHDQSIRLTEEMEAALKAAFETGDPAGELAQKACDLHRQWLCIFYPRYSKEYHMGLGEMYVADDRFRANYDKIAPGCTEFLRGAIRIYCEG